MAFIAKMAFNGVVARFAVLIAKIADFLSRFAVLIEKFADFLARCVVPIAKIADFLALFAVLIAKFADFLAQFVVLIAKMADVSVLFAALIAKMTFNYFIVVFLLFYLSVLIVKVLALRILMVTNCLEYRFAIYEVLPEQPILM
jgi:hypothetical protein